MGLIVNLINAIYGYMIMVKGVATKNLIVYIAVAGSSPREGC